MKNKNSLAIFEGKEIRKIWHNREWWFSVVDIVEVLTGSLVPRQYWGVLKGRETQLLTICLQLKLESSDGKKYATDCVNRKNALRLIQSIPSPKAEPFKMWLAQVGEDRLNEIENPELAQERMKKLYEKKGYPKNWIDKRLRGIAIRQDLTDEWQERGIKSQKDFAILTAEISKATFGMTPSAYRKFKNIPAKTKTNLRDSMTDLELIFTMLGEKVTTEISKKEKPVAMPENKKVAKRGGIVAGKARKETEKEIGGSVISKKNYREPKKLS
jgi:hypothetical protein